MLSNFDIGLAARQPLKLNLGKAMELGYRERQSLFGVGHSPGKYKCVGSASSFPVATGFEGGSCGKEHVYTVVATASKITHPTAGSHALVTGHHEH